ncbi:MAG: vitamin K epoxide reductase family protein [Acidimicrobiales bacterium]
MTARMEGSSNPPVPGSNSLANGNSLDPGTHRRARPAGPSAASVRGRPGGIGRGSSIEAELVSDDLRCHGGSYLEQRRRTAGLTLVAMAAMGVVAAYQMGLTRRPPEPDVALFDAERVDASGEAYELAKMPDAALGLASYSVTLMLAGMGAGNRARERPWIPLALAAKVAVDAASGLFLTAEQATRHGRFCSWCTLATATSLAAVPVVIPEARRAWTHRPGRP